MDMLFDYSGKLYINIDDTRYIRLAATGEMPTKADIELELRGSGNRIAEGDGYDPSAGMLN